MVQTPALCDRKSSRGNRESAPLASAAAQVGREVGRNSRGSGTKGSAGVFGEGGREKGQVGYLVRVEYLRVRQIGVGCGIC